MSVSAGDVLAPPIGDPPGPGWKWDGRQWCRPLDVVLPGLLAAQAPKLKAPLTSYERQTNAVKAIQRKVIRKAARIVECALAAGEIDDQGKDVETGLRPKGWSPKKLNVAMDARRTLKDRPYYLEVANRNHETHQRLEAARERPEVPQLNASVMQVNISQHVYQVLELPPEGK